MFVREKFSELRKEIFFFDLDEFQVFPFLENEAFTFRDGFLYVAVYYDKTVIFLDVNSYFLFYWKYHGFYF